MSTPDKNENLTNSLTMPVKANGAASHNNNNINNSNNNNNNTCSSNNNRSNNEQPQTKRQKIEKIKTKNKVSTVSGSTTRTSSKTPPPDIIDTGGELHEIHSNGIGNNNNNKQKQQQQQFCSSLSSSSHSIATTTTTPSTSNNSPTTTPCSSRTTSLTHLLNVQNALAHMLPQVTAATATGTNTANSSTCSSALSNSTAELSTDEVDRIQNLPDLLPTAEALTPSSGQVGKISRQQQCHTMPPHALQHTFSTTTTSLDEALAAQDMREFEDSLTKQCLCGVSERTLRKPFQSHYSHDALGQKRIAALREWPTNKLLQFLSNLQLLFDIYLKQNSKGFICARIMDVCDALIRNDHNLIDEIIVLASYSNAYVQFLAARVLAAFLVIAKQEMDDDWLKKLVDNLFNFERLDQLAVKKIHFSLDIIKRIVEWKDIDLHPLEDDVAAGNAGITLNANRNATSSTAHTMLELESPGDGIGGTNHGLLESLSYMHFQPQQPTMDNNYFAVHFRDDDGQTGEGNVGALGIGGAYHHTHNSHMQHNTDHDIEDPDEEDDDDDDDDDEDDEENDVADQEHSHAVRQNRGLAQLQQHFADYTAYATTAQQTSTTTTQAFHANGAQYHHQLQQHAALNSALGCHIITLTDSESFDTTHLKCITIKILENKWPALVKNMSNLIANHLDIDNAENCVLNFLQLWENIISVKANLSIVETLPFYAQLDKFELLLNHNLCCTVYKQMLCLFNEALCYGSTLALQDMLPDETCQLAHQIVRHVKDFRILESLPRHQPENIISLLGFKRKPVEYAAQSLETLQHQHQQQHEDDVIEMDKTILQKMVLLVLKSIAVTVKEIRSDSSDSSIDSTDYDAFQDMVLIERSIRDVLRKLEQFIKHTLEFHPDCHFSKILIHLFDDQDDHLIEAMVCTLDVTSGISFRNNAFPELVSMLNPVYTFLEFLKMISNSSDLLLDLLVSNETCFLLYLLRFLKYIRMNWQMFVQSCHDFGMGVSALDEAMSVLIRLRLQISRLVSRQLFPYEISPVLRLLESCESLYEGNELS